MAKPITIEPQYTEATYIEYLKQYTEQICKNMQMQGISPQNIEVQRAKYTKAVATTEHLKDIERMHQLSLYMGGCTAFCKTRGDVYSTAVATVQEYISKDALCCFGVDALARQLCRGVPLHCWYATDMRESGRKTREAWCAKIFPSTYHRIPNLKELTAETPILYKLFAECTVDDNGVALFGHSTAVVDVLDNKGNTVLNHCVMQGHTYVNPDVGTVLRVYCGNDNELLLVRVYTADDASGVKGKKAIYVTAYSPMEECRYTRTYTIT